MRSITDLIFSATDWSVFTADRPVGRSGPRDPSEPVLGTFWDPSPWSVRDLSQPVLCTGSEFRSLTLPCRQSVPRHSAIAGVLQSLCVIYHTRFPGSSGTVCDMSHTGLLGALGLCALSHSVSWSTAAADRVCSVTPGLPGPLSTVAADRLLAQPGTCRLCAARLSTPLTLVAVVTRVID